MTLITWQNGGPVLRDGQIGTGQGCCCGGDNCQCCTAEEYSDCTIEIRRLYPGGTHDVLDTVAAGDLFTSAGGCRFTITLSDENPNADSVCRINGEIDLTIETCAECEAAGGECVPCCDSPKIVACMRPTAGGACELTVQSIENCGLDATAPIGPCNGYQLVMNCNGFP